MECHVLLEHGAVSGSQRHGAFAPVRGIGKPDGIAGAVVLGDAVFLQHREESIGDILAEVARSCRLEPRFHSLEHRLFRIQEGPCRLAEEHGAGQRAMVAVDHAGDFEERALAAFHRPVIPGEMRRGGVGAGRQQGYEGRVVPAGADVAVVAQRRIVDLRHQVAFAYSGLDLFNNPGMYPLDNSRCASHIGKFLPGFHRALPVHQPGGVGERRVRQVCLERGVGRSRKPVIVHFHADAATVQAPLTDAAGEEIHGVAFGGLHEMVGVADDVIFRHEAGSPGTVGIL